MNGLSNLRLGGKISIIRSFTTTSLRLINCNSCGITLQNSHSNKVGFYIKPEQPKVDKFETLSDIRYLLFSQSVQDVKEKEDGVTREDLKASNLKLPVCKRCNDALNQNKYELEDFPRFSFENVFKLIKPNGSIANVVPLHEFPFHFKSKLLKNDTLNGMVVLSKGELCVRDKTTLLNKVPLFFKDYFKHHLGIRTNKIVGVSTTKNWNIESVYTMLKDNTYLFGNANVGKSTLINALIKAYKGHKLTAAKKNVLEEVEANRKILENPNVTLSQKQLLKAYSAGVSHIPNLTRELQTYRVLDKYIYDLPGYSDNMNEVHLDDIIDKKWLSRIRQTDHMNTSNIRKRVYESFNGSTGGKCYTVGGIFFIVPPKDTINQVIKHVRGEAKTFSNVSRGLEVFRACHDDTSKNGHPLSQYCGITRPASDISKYNRHVIPPFQGSIEIVFKDIGFMELRTTGAYSYKGLHEVWTPKGIEVCIREPLNKLISTSYMAYLESNRTKPMCPTNRPIVSSTYIMNPEETDVLGKMREMYLEKTAHDVSSRRLLNYNAEEVLSRLNHEPLNFYWYYNYMS